VGLLRSLLAPLRGRPASTSSAPSNEIWSLSLHCPMAIDHEPIAILDNYSCESVAIEVGLKETMMWPQCPHRRTTECSIQIDAHHRFFGASRTWLLCWLVFANTCWKTFDLTIDCARRCYRLRFRQITDRTTQFALSASPRRLTNSARQIGKCQGAPMRRARWPWLAYNGLYFAPTVRSRPNRAFWRVS
jgi:hypothetical protein